MPDFPFVKEYGVVKTYNIQGAPDRKPPLELLTQECIDTLDAIPFACTNLCPSPAHPKGQCDKYFNDSANCLNKLKLACAKGVSWNVGHLWDLFMRPFATLQLMGLPSDIKSAAHNIYLASIANCFPDLIGDLLKFLTQAHTQGRIKLVADFIRNAKTIEELPLPDGLTFSGKTKEASLLLIKFFEWRLPGKSVRERVDMTAYYFPLVPKK